MSTIAAQVTQSVLQLVRAIVLARLLTPDDFGLVGMVLVVTNFVQLFRDAGLSLATVQKEMITHEQVSTLFWLIVMISASLAGILCLMAPLVASFYGKQELALITAVMSLSLLFGGLAIQHQALMRRHMQFGSLAIINITSAMLSLVVTILLAILGCRYWALVLGLLASTLSSTLMTYACIPWIPGKMRKGTGVRCMLNFGGHVTGANIVNYLSLNVDNVLIGKFLGASALGLYARAYQLFMLPITQIKAPLLQLAMPVLASLKHQRERYTRYYQYIVRLLATMTMPVAFYCIVEAEFLIRLLLGDQWLEAIAVFRILAVAGIIRPVTGTWGLVTVSCGFSKRYLYWGIVNSLVMVVAIVSGLPFGISGVAYAIVVATYIMFLPCLHYCFHKTPVTVSLFLTSVCGPLWASAVAAATTLLIMQQFNVTMFGHHLLVACLFGVAYMFMTFCQGAARRDMKILVQRMISLSQTKNPSVMEAAL
ncbi:lipopolysaccharide biosynthesis protein [Planctomycetota bacterium]